MKKNGAEREKLMLAAVVSEHFTRVPRARERVRLLLRDMRATGALGAEQCLRDALGQQSLGLAYRHPDRDVLVSVAGLEVDATDPQVEIRRAGEPIAALLRAPVDTDPAVVAAVLGPAGTLTLDNERLAAAARYDLNVLRNASCELVALGDAERARIERNLHDGAQQGLVASGIALRLTAMTHPHVDVEARLKELGEVTAEVRTIAHGIHPAILAEGLDSAIEFLADEAPLRVERCRGRSAAGCRRADRVHRGRRSARERRSGRRDPGKDRRAPKGGDRPGDCHRRRSRRCRADPGRRTRGLG